ncbi:hypothetical protein CS063_16680 [Sporanaerobium hydrogeniformans]|uniref:Uncharacterized protein n=1 Tax=Sporanaerobium hydrogeniformans TaxID=3072179 RepID=A0AC61D918_9FIRM|nr:hypothetical protein [Sporanaerobium hydrogeniformans]PHV69265.1 hypothetical protein CS063_16680 [Sporanaerobium hydrogeniformans]
MLYYKKGFRNLGFMLILTLTLSMFLPYTCFAAEDKLLILDKTYTTSKLIEGDAINAKIKFCPSKDPLKITGVEVSGTAVDKNKFSYTITDGNDNDMEDTAFTTGQIGYATLRGITYSGSGSEMLITLKYEGGSVQETITLDTVSNADIQGALVLDSSITSNMSASIKAGETKKLSLQIKNSSSMAVKNGIVKISLADSVVGLSLKEGQYIELGTIQSKATKTISFIVEADSTVKAGTYKINVEMNGVKQILQLQVDSVATPPVLELSIAKDKVFKLGEVNDLKLIVKNSGGKLAKNIKLQIKNQKDVAIIGNSNVKYINSLAAGSTTTVESQIQLDSSTSTNMILLEVGLTYASEAGDEYTDTQYIYLNTDTLSTLGEMSINKVQSPSGTYMANQNFTISFQIKSEGNAKNVKVSVNPASNIIPKSQSVFVIPSIKKGETRDYIVTLAATEDITTSTYPIEILVEYEYNNEKTSIHQYASVSVSNEENEESTKPRVIIGQYQLSPQIVKAGESTLLSLDFYNTHSSKEIYNLAVTIDGSDSNNSSSNNNSSNSSGNSSNSTNSSNNSNSDIFIPVSGSNTLFVTKLAPREIQTRQIELSTLGTTTAKTYLIAINISYEDNKGNILTSTETIAIPVEQELAIDVAQIQIGNLTQGRGTSITATLYNTGKADINNVMIYLEGEGFAVEDNKSYLSTFSKGATEYYLPTVTPITTGKLQATLVIEYDDNTGAKQSIRHPFEMEVVERTTNQNEMTNGKEGMSERSGMPMNGAPHVSQSVNKWVIVVLALAVAAGAFITFKVIKRRKQIKGMHLHE